MKPHHCRYCGELLRTWHERECHMDMRAANGGACRTPSTALPPEEVERRKALDRTFDMAKMRERAESARAAEAAPAPGSTKPRSPLN